MAKLYMETTSVSVEKTVAEICSVLVRAGALQVNQQFENRKIIGLRWTMNIHGQEVPFSMPARIEPVYKTLLNNLSPRSQWKVDRTKLRGQAERVAWRQLLRWAQAQLAMIDTGMVQSAEVFMPYVHMPTGRTLFEQLEQSHFKGLLTAGVSHA